MKKFKQFIAFVLALCMLFSLSVAAFAAEPEAHTIYDSAPDEEATVSAETATSGTIPDSKIKWELNEHNWLMISGSGDCAPFASKDDQPWAAVRDQITQVWFDDMENLAISDLAYWFEDCVNLTTAEIPGTTPVIGKHAFYNCPKLSTLTIYYGEDILESIGEDAFWREADSGDTLYIAHIIGYPEATVPFHTYDWAASNRSALHYEDVYGVSLAASVVGTCPSCKQNSLQGVYVGRTHEARGHAEYNKCYRCAYTQYLGTYVYKNHGAGTEDSWTCPSCGSHTWVLQSQQPASCTANGYAYYSCACGQTKSEMIYASGHNYSYGNWMQYSSSQHQRSKYCMNCGSSDYEYGAHSLSYGSWSRSSSTQHSRSVSCGVCGYSTTETGSHSYSYGSWSKYDETQHRRTKTCSACSDSDYEYGDHRDSNADGVCDDCGANVALIVTWDAASNGGTVGGKNSVTTSVAPNQTAVAPGYTPVKAGHTFSGWYTEKAGGALYSTVTITAARTFYAQFTPAEYKITWDLGIGKTETTNQTYGETLNLPAEPARKGYAFLGWFTQETGGTQVDGNTLFKEVASTTYYAHWEEATVFSVVVPAVLPVTVDQNGKVYVSNAEIVNHSTAAVQVSSVTLTAENGWTLVPYASDMSHAKVDSNQIGFKINSAQTSKTGSTEQLVLTSPWQIAEEESLTLSYDAVVSALSQPVTNANILSVLFVVEWA